ncbi:VPS9 domain-containing protein 1 [Patella vulgata]|uniref:VPS9 domain-containing protein 1 n=1 Tax=Patella vulgata TaxID=6465 RepID=UPI0024A7DE4B|nr:VPS9 domain-containing protein 1 [Patella vulgata]
MDQCLTKVMRSIGEALKLDDNNNYHDAYLQYVECVLNIASNLLQYVRADGGKIIISKSVEKQIELGKQCMERLSSLREEFTAFEQTKTTQSPHVKQIGRFAAPVPPLPSNNTDAAYSLKRTLTPTEIAFRQNQSIMRAYKARMAKMSSGNPQAASLSLTIQRKLAENLAIANAQEQALSEKMRDTQRRLDDQAARRFASPVGMSEDEQEQRHIYKKILQYEQQAKWLLEWRKKLSNSPKDPVIISQLITEILRCEDHPLTVLLKKYQYKIYERLYPLVSTKMADINEISVPLPLKYYPSNVTPTEMSPEKVDNEKSVECVDGAKNVNIGNNNIQTDNKDDCDIGRSKNVDIGKNNIETENKDDCDNGSSGNVDIGNNSIDKDNKDDCDIVSDTENVMTNLEIAVDKNEQLCQNLEEENQKVSLTYRSLSKEYEQYNDEDMDDLFDDDNDDAGRPECDKADYLPKPSNQDSYVVLSVKDVNQQSNSKDKFFNFRRQSLECEKLKDEAYCRHLKSMSQDVHNALEKLIVMFAITYEELDSAEGQDQCYASLEEPFFKPIWKYLLTLFRLSNKNQEITLAYNMTKHTLSTPEDYGVSKKLCLTSDMKGLLPFQSAIDELCKLKNHYTMLSKLECVVNVCRLVCDCVENFYVTKQIEAGEISSTPSVGADDLLPILTYIVIKSGIPQLVSECQAMAEFIHEGYIMGEEGYCLTSLQTAITYVCSTDKS